MLTVTIIMLSQLHTCGGGGGGDGGGGGGGGGAKDDDVLTMVTILYTNPTIAAEPDCYVKG